jgi:hypothetical protein
MRVHFLLAVVTAACLAVFIAGGVQYAHGATRAVAAPKTTEPDVYDDIDVTITDRKITLSDRAADRGNGVNLHVKNVGTKPHSFAFVGPGAIGLSGAGLSTPVLQPGKTYVLQVYMDNRGALPYRSTVKADAGKIGMRGVFLVR